MRQGTRTEVSSMAFRLLGVFPKCFTEFAESTDKNICHYSKKVRTGHFCEGNQDATTASARHMWETGSLNRTQVMLQWFQDFKISLNLPNSMKVVHHLRNSNINLVLGSPILRCLCQYSSCLLIRLSLDQSNLAVIQDTRSWFTSFALQSSCF